MAECYCCSTNMAWLLLAPPFDPLVICLELERTMRLDSAVWACYSLLLLSFPAAFAAIG